MTVPRYIVTKTYCTYDDMRPRSHAPPQRAPELTSTPWLTKRRALLGLALAASGVAATAIGTHALTNDPATPRVRAADSPVTNRPMSPAGSLSCAIYTVPTMDTAAIPLSTMTDGSPYVIDCEDPTGHDVINQIAVHNRGR
jgi:hypothetical protein